MQKPKDEPNPLPLCCDYCGKKYCGKVLNPLHEFHEKSDCPMDDQLKQILLMDPNYKLLECCNTAQNIPQEKPPTCNRVTCNFCKKYSCWLCKKYYSDMDECYDHLTQEHGGLYNNDEIAKLKENGAKILRCCNFMVEKIAGTCNKVFCEWGCRKYYNCWLCISNPSKKRDECIFLNESDCYRHLNTVHKGYFTEY